MRRVSTKEFALSWHRSLRLVTLVLRLGTLLSLGIVAPNGFGKEPVLIAIALYDASGPGTANGAAYVQLSDVLINGKAEMRDCDGAVGAGPGQTLGPPMDKSAYGKLGKTELGPGGILDRGVDGVMHYRVGTGTPVCVLPSNVKFEHNASFTLSELADQGQLHGTPIGVSSDGSPLSPIVRKGMTLYFVGAADVDLAEYLRARRASDVEGWRGYLDKHPDSIHVSDAKAALATLYVTAGDASLAAYQKSAGSDVPSYAVLKNAKTQADLARALVPAFAPADKLLASVRANFGAITDRGRAELDAYRAALSAHGPGYLHLLNAKTLSEAMTGMDAQYPPGQALQRDVQAESAAIESAMQSASTAVKAKETVKAAVLIQPYRAFAPEEPRLSQLIDGIYAYHMDQGGQAGGKLDWAASIAEFKKAQEMKDTPEVKAALKNADDQLVITQNEAAAKLADDKSKGFEEDHDAIQAYEVLAALTPAQQVLVKDDMERLAPGYIQSATQEAQKIGKAHDPIRGINDAFEIANAYAYYQRAYELSNHDDSYLFKMNVLGDELSTFYLSQAVHYLAKPEGSGTELGWAYIEEALAFKASNQDKVRDARTGAEAAHAMHSKLSIQVQFRDGTSQRDSQGFAGQLENAIISGLERSSTPVKAIRFGESSTVKPDFQLIGDVQQHHVSDTATPQSMDSTYFAGEHEEPNERWNKANRDYESANLELQTAQSKLQGAEAKGNKKAIEDMTSQVALLQKKVSEAHLQLDSLPKSTKTPIDHPYTYTRKTIDYKGTIELQFRIGEILNGQMTDFVPVVKEDHKQVVILEGVNAVDTKGIKPEGAVLDKNEMLAGLEKQAGDALIEAVRVRVDALPKTIYDAAKKKELDGDMDGAAEGYLRYLNCTRGEESAERTHARAYLLDQFHLKPDANVAP